MLTDLPKQTAIYGDSSLRVDAGLACGAWLGVCYESEF
jgi:hypothetical protein